MKKILIKILDNTLFFSYKANNIDQHNNLLNTNVISNDELIFSDIYMNENTKIVSLFIKDLADERNISTIIIEKNDMVPTIIKVLVKLNIINTLYLKENTPLSFDICEKIIELKKIKNINCYSIPNYMIELLDKSGISVDSRCEIFSTSDFMQNNNLTSYSKMYYKFNLRITSPMNEADLDDFDGFCKINRYLKTIHLDKCDIEAIDNIVERLYENRIKNVKVFIHDNINDEKTVEALKRINRRYSKKYKISLKLNYDEEYIKDNYLKQIIFNTLKVCSFLIFVIIGCVLSYIFINNKTSEDNVNKINDQIDTVLQSVITDEDEEKNNSSSLTSLLSVNSDTVGWIKVNGTNIDYPVVQTDDNSYYLKRNYNKEKDYNGWVFMDYRNDKVSLDKNTIIYAHNRYYSGVMFGTLNNVTKKKWQNDEGNQLITFNTLYENLTWKVFSIYSIKTTSDYLYTEFETDDDWLDFVDLITNRSDYKFNTEVTKDDKIITLSTCLENDRRLVVHAVLQN